MKAFRTSILILFLAFALNSCFDEPHFPLVPEIVFNDLYLKVTPDISDYDTLVLMIDFKDGDGDLGLNGQSDIDASYPYQLTDYYQQDGNGGMKPIPTIQVQNYTVLEPEDNNKLITNRTRSQPGYENLPAFNFNKPLGCQPYIVQDLLLDSLYYQSIDGLYHITDTLYEQATHEPYYSIADTLYFTFNENHYNITIQFLVKNNDGTFTEFNWRDEFCTTYDGRFPILSNDGESNPLEGTIRYDMGSNGWLPLFSIKTLKLRIYIKDRALNKSNVIETPEFTLDKIRR